MARLLKYGSNLRVRLPTDSGLDLYAKKHDLKVAEAARRLILERLKELHYYKGDAL